jgi:hypothetical protein
LQKSLANVLLKKELMKAVVRVGAGFKWMRMGANVGLLRTTIGLNRRKNY